MSRFFLLLAPITVLVQFQIDRTFIQPSETLALTKARLSDQHNERKAHGFMRANRGEPLNTALLLQTDFENEEDDTDFDTEEYTAPTGDDGMTLNTDERKATALESYRRRYLALDSMSLSSASVRRAQEDYFVYRQPAMNPAIWEKAPREYRPTDDTDADLW